jgi:hypothetical protein
MLASFARHWEACSSSTLPGEFRSNTNMADQDLKITAEQDAADDQQEVEYAQQLAYYLYKLSIMYNLEEKNRGLFS